MTGQAKAGRWRRVLSALALVAALGYVAVRLGSGAWALAVDSPYPPAEGGAQLPAVTVSIPRGSSAARVAALLEERGLVRSAWLFRWYLRTSDQADRLQAGDYRLEPPLSMRQVAEVLVSGRVILDPVTIPEGHTVWGVARTLAAAGFGTYDEALAATARVGLVAGLDPEATDLEGYLFPDTYLAPGTATAADVVEMMVERFRTVWTPARQARARELEMSVREVVTLASLVEAETGLAEERPLVGGVFHNRLERGMLLQCDPTLLYALRLAGRTDRNIRRSDFDVDSPYNTYRYGGLPAGPIASPGEASLDAALYPADTEFLYFVGRNDGSHAFARTLREHNANVNRFQRGR